MSIEHGFVILVAGDGLGRGDDDLGRRLMGRFLHELGGQRNLPEKIIFLNSGVRLVVGGSPVLGQLARLAETGVEIVACGTCLEKFGLLTEVAVGGKTDMGTTVAALAGATKVLSI
jgi:selenium metabolism protein YedF